MKKDIIIILLIAVTTVSLSFNFYNYKKYFNNVDKILKILEYHNSDYSEVYLLNRLIKGQKVFPCSVILAYPQNDTSFKILYTCNIEDSKLYIIDLSEIDKDILHVTPLVDK